MTKLEQAARQALDALEELFHSNSTKVAVEKYNTAHNALREALAEQALQKLADFHQMMEQEPVGEMIDKAGYKGAAWYLEPPTTGTQLYASPLAKQDTHATHVVRTKDLTDDEIHKLIKQVRFDGMTDRTFQFARAVIAADREKNRG